MVFCDSRSSVLAGQSRPPTEEELDAFLEQVKNNPEEYDKAYPQDVYRGIFH